MRVEAQFPNSLPCKVALVGESPGEKEAEEGRPFVGASGQFLDRCLKAVGLNREELLVTNVFTTRPPDNKVKAFFMNRTEAKKKSVGLADSCPFPVMEGNGFLREEHWPEMERLRGELERAAPNIIVGLGGTALWALTSHAKIGTYRGAVMPSVFGFKCISTYHPAAVLRQYSQRPLLMADLAKAKRQSDFPEINQRPHTIHVAEALADFEWFAKEHLQDTECLSVDIETDRDTNQITCIGFAPSPDIAFVVPIWQGVKGGSYWPEWQELEVWKYIKAWCESAIPKVFQNGLYDIQYLTHYKVYVRNYRDDTMYLHHALQPELRKSLGVLGSVYLNEPAWKPLGRHKVKDETKPDG